jgi:uncharacterized protein YwgA
MDRLKRAAVLTRLIERLRTHGSWCGETHVQKSAFFLQDLMKVPLEFDFILYKHGPFSFDLRDDLTGLRADELIRLEPQWPYGPQIMSTDRSEHIQRIFSKTLDKYDGRISFIAEKLGYKGVADLEQLATALFVTQREEANASVAERSKKLTALKPHISAESARAAVEEVDCIVKEARGQPQRRGVCET